MGLFLGVPYYIWDPKRDPNLKNYPCRTLLVPLSDYRNHIIETLVDPLKESQKGTPIRELCVCKCAELAPQPRGLHVGLRVMGAQVPWRSS